MAEWTAHQLVVNSHLGSDWGEMVTFKYKVLIPRIWTNFRVSKTPKAGQGTIQKFYTHTQSQKPNINKFKYFIYEFVFVPLSSYLCTLGVIFLLKVVPLHTSFAQNPQISAQKCFATVCIALNQIQREITLSLGLSLDLRS